MANLITSHDPFHIHKLLGLLVLFHFLYRIGLAFLYADAFPATEARSVQIGWVLLHGALSWSSLLLPLPQKRNFSSPMIWPEFRFHSIAFVTRHVVATVVTLAGLWPDSFLHEALCKTALLVATVYAARLITDRFGDRERRTTNAMPYPPTVGAPEVANIKLNYTSAQFLATMHCIMGDPTMCFLPLLGLQMAPLLMTLVRKGIVSSATYHRVYSAALYMPYCIMVVRLLANTFSIHTMVIFGLVAVRVVKASRTTLGIPAEVCWMVGAPIALACHYYLTDYLTAVIPQTPLVNQLGALLFVVKEHSVIVKRYAPLVASS
eukprot:m.28472 g.28472  ORF g.28472 m.28472 type:complete len:320 (+) comp12020_c0_seq3:554-1513(+)